VLGLPAVLTAGPGPPGAAAVLPALPVAVGALAPAAVAGLALPAVAALPACVPCGTLLVPTPTPGALPPPQLLAMISVRAQAPCNAGWDGRLP